MLFVEVSNKLMKKIDFNQFGTVLARIALRIYVDENKTRLENVDPLEYTIKFINEFLLNLNLNDEIVDN